MICNRGLIRAVNLKWQVLEVEKDQAQGQENQEDKLKFWNKHPQLIIRLPLRELQVMLKSLRQVTSLTQILSLQQVPLLANNQDLVPLNRVDTNST